MKVSEVIKNTNNYVITKEGKILGINNTKDELLNLEVQKVQVIEGLIEDLTCIRI